MSISAFHSRCDAASSDLLRDRRVSWLWPAAFVLAGVGWLLVPGAAGALEPYRWLFLFAGLASWAVAYRERRRAMVACAAEACGTPRSRRFTGILVWASLAALLTAAAYPYVVAWIA